jgi:hypothetical protein
MLIFLYGGALVAVTTGTVVYVDVGTTAKFVGTGQSRIRLQVALGLGSQPWSAVGLELMELTKLSELDKEVPVADKLGRAAELSELVTVVIVTIGVEEGPDVSKLLADSLVLVAIKELLSWGVNDAVVNDDPTDPIEDTMDVPTEVRMVVSSVMVSMVDKLEGSVAVVVGTEAELLTMVLDDKLMSKLMIRLESDTDGWTRSEVDVSLSMELDGDSRLVVEPTEETVFFGDVVTGLTRLELGVKLAPRPISVVESVPVVDAIEIELVLDNVVEVSAIAGLDAVKSPDEVNKPVAPDEEVDCEGAVKMADDD